MTDPGRYTFDAHLRDRDDMVVKHLVGDPTMVHRAHADAWRDVRLKLKGHGYIDRVVLHEGGLFDPYTLDRQAQSAAEPANDFAKATTTVSFTAAATGDLVVPASTRVTDVDPDDPDSVATGARVFLTDVALNVPAGTTATVAATAEHEGEPWNIPSGATLYLEGGASSLANFASSATATAASGGVDHQLTRAATWRALELVYLNLTSHHEDSFDRKRARFAEYYRQEIDDLVSAGIRMEVEVDGVETTEEERLKHGFHRLDRG